MQKFTRAIGKLAEVQCVLTGCQSVCAKILGQRWMFNVLYAQNMRYMGDIAELLASHSYGDDNRNFTPKTLSIFIAKRPMLT